MLSFSTFYHIFLYLFHSNRTHPTLLALNLDSKQECLQTPLEVGHMVDEVGVLGNLGVGAAVLQEPCAVLQALQYSNYIILQDRTGGQIKSHMCTHAHTYTRTHTQLAAHDAHSCQCVTISPHLSRSQQDVQNGHGTSDKHLHILPAKL